MQVRDIPLARYIVIMTLKTKFVLYVVCLYILRFRSMCTEMSLLSYTDDTASLIP